MMEDDYQQLLGEKRIEPAEPVGDCLNSKSRSSHAITCQSADAASAARSTGRCWYTGDCARCGEPTEHAPDGRCFPCFQRANRLAVLFAESGIPDRHAKITTWESLASDRPAHARAVKAVRQFLADPDATILAVIGPRGLGKSQVGVVAVAETIRSLQAARRVHALDLIADLKASIGTPENEADWQAEWGRPFLLVLDEITQRVASEWTTFNLTRLLDRRYESNRPTILIGNVSRGELAGVVGASTIDRMNEGGGIIECTWPSFRARQPAGNGEQQRDIEATIRALNDLEL